MDQKQQNAQTAEAEAVANTLTSLRLRQAATEIAARWQGDPSPLRRALFAHFEQYNLTAPRTQESDRT